MVIKVIKSQCDKSAIHNQTIISAFLEIIGNSLIKVNCGTCHWTGTQIIEVFPKG